MEIEQGKIYQIEYRSFLIEGIYLGQIKKYRKINKLILLNISPESERLPEHFPLIGIKDLEITENKIIYDKSMKNLRKIKVSKLEQEFLNTRGKKVWGEN